MFTSFNLGGLGSSPERYDKEDDIRGELRRMNKNSLWGGKGGRTLQTVVTAGTKAQRHESAYFMSVCVCTCFNSCSREEVKEPGIVLEHCSDYLSLT